MKIKVLLLENVAKLWNKGDIVEVSDAYARNVLFRTNKAKIADKATIKAYEKKQQKLQQEKQQLKEKINKALEDIKQNWLILKVSAADDGHLYEKVDSKHIENAFVEKYGFRPENRQIEFPIKKANKLGEYEFFFVLDWKKIPLTLKVERK